MKRRGITLTEVLVAIFVTGLGLMALMTLFPLGAVNMALAIKDDRAQHAGANATALLRTVWRQGLENGQPDPNIAVPLQNGPVYVDPIGKMTYAGGGANHQRYQYPRVSLTATSPACRSPCAISACRTISHSTSTATRWPRPPRARYPLHLGLHASPATGRQPAGGGFFRGRLQPPLRLGLRRRAQRARQPLAETSTADNSITIAGQPKVHKGSWVLDASTGFFYRVNSVMPGMLKVDQPLRTQGATRS